MDIVIIPIFDFAGLDYLHYQGSYSLSVKRSCIYNGDGINIKSNATHGFKHLL